MRDLITVSLSLILLAGAAPGQETHDHKPPEKLGAVSFPVSCAPAVQQPFNRAVALLHSFAYTAARHAFEEIATQDPRCAMAHWGAAMSHFHQLWEPSIPAAEEAAGEQEIKRAETIGSTSERQQGYMHALNQIYSDVATVPFPVRAGRYEQAMSELYRANESDVEVEVFYALALLANASPRDKTHAKQKQAADLLEPLSREYPQHPGIAHYLIHACDNAEMASRGLPAARAYAQIASSAPHALHMPSHIFTRLGLWDESIASNIAARTAGHEQGDTGEELHAMDYLVYAYLQTGRYDEAQAVIAALKTMRRGEGADFKITYATTAMPVRYAVERGRWEEAAAVRPAPGASGQVVAVAVWARGLGLARTGHPEQARAAADQLHEISTDLGRSGKDYWASQVAIQEQEVRAWIAQAEHRPEEAQKRMRSAADDEDAIEKLPVTPGPIVPAREQLGFLLLQQNQPAGAHKEFERALVYAPGRRGALQGLAQSAPSGRSGL